MISPNNILIVDDNPFPTRECIRTLTRKLYEQKISHKKTQINYDADKILEEAGFDNLEINYPKVRGKVLNFRISEDIKLILYNYDASILPEINQNKIIEIIDNEQINILWVDRGYSLFYMKEKKMYGNKDAKYEKCRTNSDALFDNTALTQALINNKIKQTAVYTYNPSLGQTEIQNKRESIARKLQVDKELIYVLETSLVLNLFEKDERLSDGTEDNGFYGTEYAYKQYGRLLGNILSDLFLQVDSLYHENRGTNRYSFFRAENRGTQQYIKTLHKNIKSDFQVGLLSFQRDSTGTPDYLIDIPYKEYYRKYDKHLEEENISSIFPRDTGDTEKGLFIYYLYGRQKNIEGKYSFTHECSEELINKASLIRKNLPLLHTGVFYEPIFYEKPSFPFDKFEHVEDPDSLPNFCENICEFYYLLKTINFEDNTKGIVHLVLWRRYNENTPGIKREVENIWENYYPFVESIIVASIIPILHGEIKKQLSETLKQAQKAAISQVMNRQMSHNINSHVMANLVNKNFEAHDHKDIKAFLRYLQSRIEFIADIVTSEPLVTFPSKLDADIVQGFLGKTDEKTWPLYVIKYISGSNEVADANIKIEIADREHIVIVALPNAMLGAQAFYVILENIIRNSVKHSRIPLESHTENGCETQIKKLRLKISLESDPDTSLDYYKAVIWDNLGACNSQDRGRADFGSHQNSSFDQWMNTKICRNVLDDHGKLRQNDWGLLEMKICAAYLRKFPLDKLDDKQVSPKLFNVVMDSERNIGYELYLLRPKLACIVMKNDFSCDYDKGALEAEGIHPVKKDNLDDLDGLLKYGKLKLKDGKKYEVSHLYLVFEKGVFGENKKVKSNQHAIELDREDVCNLFKSEHKELYLLKKLCPSPKEIKLLEISDRISDIVDADKDKIIFHDHGKSSSQDTGCLSNLFYYESYGSQSATAALVKSIASNNEENPVPILRLELNLAATMQVGILDERIQAEAERGKIRILLGATKIFIPNSNKIDLNKNDFNESQSGDGNCSKPIKEKIKVWLGEQKSICDYILVHQGIIEKTIGSTDIEKINEFIGSYYIDGDKKAELIIISGRGKPSNLPKDVFYLPFSLVNQYVITYPSKIYLYKLLKSARRLPYL